MPYSWARFSRSACALAIAFVSGAHAGAIGTVTIVNKDYTLNDLTIAPQRAASWAQR